MRTPYFFPQRLRSPEALVNIVSLDLTWSILLTFAAGWHMAPGS